MQNTFGALCMNERGVAMFMAYRPFEKLFRVLLSPRYLPAMKRKRQNHHAADFRSGSSFSGNFK